MRVADHSRTTFENVATLDSRGIDIGRFRSRMMNLLSLNSFLVCVCVCLCSLSLPLNVVLFLVDPVQTKSLFIVPLVMNFLLLLLLR